MERANAEPEVAGYSDSYSESDYNCSEGRAGSLPGFFWTQGEGAKNANVHLIRLAYTCFNSCGDAY